MTGQPVARLARSRVESATALTTVGTPAASANASSRAAIRSLESVGEAPAPVASCSRSAAALTSASSRDRVAFFWATRSAMTEILEDRVNWDYGPPPAPEAPADEAPPPQES